MSKRVLFVYIYRHIVLVFKINLNVTSDMGLYVKFNVFFTSSVFSSQIRTKTFALLMKWPSKAVPSRLRCLSQTLVLKCDIGYED